MNLSKRLIQINKSLGTVGENKVDLAVVLFETKSSTFWPETKYGSWKGFCNLEVALSQSAIYVYVRTAKTAIDNGFHITDMKHIVDSIGWERFRIGISKLDKSETVNVITFIKKFKDLNLNERVKYEDSESSLVTFNFSIPKEAAADLTNELIVRGMRATNKSRANMSSAMVKLINDLVKGD